MYTVICDGCGKDVHEGCEISAWGDKKFVCYHCGKDYFGMLLNNKKEQIIVIPLDSIIEYSKMPNFFGMGFKNNLATMMFYKLFNNDDVMTLDMFKKIIIEEHNPIFKN